MIVVAACFLYGFWLLLQFLGFLFVLGDNDTKLEVLGGLAYFLTPIPATLLAWRRRKLAALLLLFSAALFILGVIDDEIYLQARFADSIPQLQHHVNPRRITLELVRMTGPFVGVAVFYLITDLFKWPRFSETPSAAHSEPGCRQL